MSVRVLLGAADAELAAALRTQVGELNDIEIVAVESSSADVVSAASQDPAIDVVLVHQEIDGMSAMDLIRELAMRHPHLAVVVVTEDASPARAASSRRSPARPSCRAASGRRRSGRVRCGATSTRPAPA
jgi:pilus assembly protein CpaE